MRGVIRAIKCPLCLNRAASTNATVVDVRKHVNNQKKKKGYLDLVPSNQKLALLHFDTYYSQIYGQVWPGIRLALLSPQMYMAVINNFGDSEAMISNMQRAGYNDFVPSARAAAKQHLANLVLKKDEEEEKGNEMESDFSEWIGDTPVKLSGISRALSEESRTNLNEFVPVTEVTTEHELLVRLDKNSSLSSPFLEWADAETQASPQLPVVTETVFDISPTLRLFVSDDGHINRLPSPRSNSNGLAPYLPLNGASALPVLALNLQPGDSVLDMCAAPGGKTVMMLQSQLPHHIVCVDSSSSRLTRMRAVVDCHGVPRSTQDRDITFVHGNACKIDLGAGYDKVLLDAPCSTDRHAVSKNQHNIFARTRSNERLKLPQRQVSLLQRALQAVRVGGEVVYSTCTLSVNQNEAVVREAVRRLADEMSLAVVDLAHLRSSLPFLRFGQPLRQPQLGLTVLPSILQNYGPCYVCKLRRES